MTYGLCGVTYSAVKAHEVLRLRIQQRMEALNLRPADLNRLIGKSNNWAYGYLKGERDVPVDLLDRLSEVLDVTVPSLFDESQLNSPSLGTSKGLVIDEQTERGQDASAPPAHPSRSEGSMTREERALVATLQSMSALPKQVQRRLFLEIDIYATGLKSSAQRADAPGKRRRRGGTA